MEGKGGWNGEAKDASVSWAGAVAGIGVGGGEVLKREAGVQFEFVVEEGGEEMELESTEAREVFRSGGER